MSDPRPRNCAAYLREEAIAFPNLCAICAAGPCPYGKAKAEAAVESKPRRKRGEAAA